MFSTLIELTVTSSANNFNQSSRAEITECVSDLPTVAATASTPQWVFLLLGVFPVWILVGNSLVVLALLFQRNLQNLSNRVIASLAVTDFLLALVVVPLNIYQLVGGSVRSYKPAHKLEIKLE